MRAFLYITFFLGTVWDFATSFLGISGIFGVTNFTDWDISTIAICITAFVGSLIILGLSLYSGKIWAGGINLLCYIHIGAVIFDAYTSFLGTAQNILLKDSRSVFVTIGISDVLGKLSFEEIVVLGILTVLITGSPIMLAKLADLDF